MYAYKLQGVSKICNLDKKKNWFSGNTTFHWNNTPRCSNYTGGKKAQNIEKFDISVTKLVKLWKCQS